MSIGDDEQRRSEVCRTLQLWIAGCFSPLRSQYTRRLLDMLKLSKCADSIVPRQCKPIEMRMNQDNKAAITVVHRSLPLSHDSANITYHILPGHACPSPIIAGGPSYIRIGYHPQHIPQHYRLDCFYFGTQARPWDSAAATPNERRGPLRQGNRCQSAKGTTTSTSITTYVGVHGPHSNKQYIRELDEYTNSQH